MSAEILAVPAPKNPEEMARRNRNYKDDEGLIIETKKLGNIFLTLATAAFLTSAYYLGSLKNDHLTLGSSYYPQAVASEAEPQKNDNNNFGYTLAFVGANLLACAGMNYRAAAASSKPPVAR